MPAANSGRVAVRRRGSRCARGRRACAGRRRPRPRPACRRRRPRGPPARTTPTGWAPRRRRRPGSRWTAGGGAAAATKRTWSATPSSSTSGADAASSASPSAPLGPADHDQRRVGSAAAAARARTATSRPLSGWMRPTNSSTGPGRRGRSAGRAPGAVAGREEGVVDARRHDLDAGRGRRRRARTSWSASARARGEDGVGAADDLGLGLDAALRLGVAGLGLDPGERVERGHERQVELVLELVAGHARQPVVGVDGVDVAAPLEVLGHARR